MRDLKLLMTALVAITLMGKASYAESTGSAESLKTAEPEAFEIIDGTAPVAGEPDPASKGARTNWKAACAEWKKEIKDLNKKNEVLALSCASPDCAYQENGSYVCSSTAVYKLKTAGVRAPPAPKPAEVPAQKVFSMGPPQMIVEAKPAPMSGFVWVNGYWGWQNTRHIWYPGHWQAAQPGRIWVDHRWIHRPHGWHFEIGHWDDGHL